MYFYPLDEELVVSLLEYIVTGLAQRDTCVVMARPQTLINLNKKLRAVGVNVDSVLHTGEYITFDAEELLARFMCRGMPNCREFLKEVGGVMSSATGRGRPVRAFGDMEALLLDQQNIAGLVSLERCWNDLMKVHAFSLYCAYPEAAFQPDSKHNAVFQDVCDCHTEAVGGATG
jgi:hypothetical protein